MNKIMKNLKKNDGFTLIEILVVIGIIAILAVIVLIAINPARQFAQARDTQRDSNVNAILNGIGQYIADHKGDLPPAIIGAYSDDAIEICGDLVPDYLPAMPTDPNSTAYDGVDTDCSDSSDTAYVVERDDTSGRITVRAPETEIRDEDGNGTVDEISVTR